MYCIDPTAEEPIFLINKHIGFDDEEGMGINGADFARELLQVDTLGKKAIQIWINSPGGVVSDGYDIFSAILKTKTPVDTYCIGAAASIAGVFFQAGRKRIMMDYAWLMYHNPFVSNGKLSAEAKLQLDTMRNSLLKMVSQKCGMTEDKVSEMFNRTSYISASEAVEMGLCDRVDASAEENTKHLRKIKDSNVFMLECNKVLNSILNKEVINNNLPKQVKMDIVKVTMRLKLNDSAPQEDIVAAIDAIENRARLAEAKIEEVQNSAKTEAKNSADELNALGEKLKKALKDAENAQKEYSDCKSKLDSMEAEKDEVEKAAKAEKAKNMVEGFAKVGRIKNEAVTVAKWTELAIVDFDGTKNMIEDLPLNKVAPVLNLEPNQLQDGEIPTTAIGMSVKNRLKREGKI